MRDLCHKDAMSEGTFYASKAKISVASMRQAPASRSHEKGPTDCAALRSTAADSLRIVRRVTGCHSFSACKAVYDTIAFMVGEAWIRSGTLGLEATEALHGDAFSRLRDGTLSRPVGRGIRPKTTPR